MTKIKDYTLVEPPLKGGMALVYKGEKPGFSRAFKLVRPDKAENSSKLCSQFLKEISIQSKLDHPNIIRILDAYPHQNEKGKSFTVLEMEWLNGLDLQRYIETKAKSGLKEEEVKKILLQTLDGLEYAHNHNILHLDIKPSNLFRTNDGYIKIIDFGIARVVGDNAEIIDGAEKLTRMTETGESTFKGTLAYASPEQQVGGKLSFASDIYSLGKTLRFLCTGTTDPSAEIKSALLADIIEKCTIENPKKRFQSCSELRDAIAVSSAPKQIICPNCKNNIDSTVKFCPICGKKDPGQVVPELECPACHKPVDKNDKCCTKCGQSLFVDKYRILSIWKCSCGKGNTLSFDNVKPNFCCHCGQSKNTITLTKL